MKLYTHIKKKMIKGSAYRKKIGKKLFFTKNSMFNRGFINVYLDMKVLKLKFCYNQNYAYLFLIFLVAVGFSSFLFDGLRKYLF